MKAKLGKALKWSAAGEEMTDSEDMREEMTSVEAGWMFTRFAAGGGRERWRRESLTGKDVRAGMTGAYEEGTDQSIVTTMAMRRICTSGVCGKS